MASLRIKLTQIVISLIVLGSVQCKHKTKTKRPLNFTEIATEAGLECEEHKIVTDDGYILDMFHIPGDPSRNVLLVSGAFGTADDYILSENYSLPYVLSKEGYDVWVGNVRGCRYGRSHVTLDPDKDAKFWNFTFHEYAVSDLPCMIDYVLNETKQEQVSTIGWSLGTTDFYIMGSERPEYTNKVKVMISLAPICFLHHSPAFSVLQYPAPELMELLFGINKNEIFGENCIETKLLRSSCSSVEDAEKYCFPLFSLIYGIDITNVPAKAVPTEFSHYPSSMSTKTLDHLVQVLIYKRITKFDYGSDINQYLYGSAEPPEYDLCKNNMNIHLISGKNDMTSTLPDVELLKTRLPNIIEHKILDPPKFNHLDFVYGKESMKKLYRPVILKILKKYN